VPEAKLTDWGLEHISVEKHHTILDVGCGGGKTVSKQEALKYGNYRRGSSVFRIFATIVKLGSTTLAMSYSSACPMKVSAPRSENP
jgi:hypothetical protein